MRLCAYYDEVEFFNRTLISIYLTGFRSPSFFLAFLINFDLFFNFDNDQHAKIEI